MHDDDADSGDVKGGSENNISATEELEDIWLKN